VAESARLSQRSAMTRPLAHYTLVCKHCTKTIMKTRNRNVPRPVRLSVCRVCGPAKGWDYRDAPLVTR
jgi:RNase P subunit RPR2